LEFIADLHIHSRFSRATARNLNLPTLDRYASRKGLSVIGTGDLTHPAWLAEIEEQLEEAEPGLYRLRPGLALEPGGGGARFLLSAEISSIYKKAGRVRKVHSLILLPDLAAARRLHERLDAMGNVRSDGRPILGLDAKDLLEICLEISPETFFIPAHIWTPWFSLLGSKSGFDSVEACFEDLSGHIHALETGLSSDPAMNWRLSALDRYVLISNSDAHSPDKLGREANLFDTEMSYPAMVRAMRGQGGFGGTLEFFPEEGKYHLDGHRKCDQRLDPEETDRLGGLCPACGRPVTVGVMNRVLELADRPDGHRPDGAAGFTSLIPLAEVLGEAFDVGPKSKRVQAAYEELLAALGPELDILRRVPLDDIRRVGGDLLAEGLDRMRQGRVRAEAGYDGEFGTIRLFEAGERERLGGQTGLFQAARPSAGRTKRKASPEKPPQKSRSVKSRPKPPPLLRPGDALLDDLNPAQREAVTYGGGPLCIAAGPGTGKTLVLTRRAAWLVREGTARPDRILGLTFTRQAAAEMSGRLAHALPFGPPINGLPVMTFHALGLRLLSESTGRELKVLPEDAALILAKKAAQGSPFKTRDLSVRISLAKQGMKRPEDLEDPELARAWERYEAGLAQAEAMDFDDLVVRTVRLFETSPDFPAAIRERWPWLLIDEYQDVNQAQYRLTRLLAGEGAPDLTVIGDPDQAIYGFRGADAAYFQRFAEDYPSAARIRLTRNYRSTPAILAASAQVIGHNPGRERAELNGDRDGPARITMAEMATPRAEAEYVASRIERLLGGTSHFALDSGRADGGRDSDLTLADVAVLYRLHAQAPPLAEALERAGLPFQQAGQEPLRETDGLDFAAEKISLLTMHAAKGLEFEIVFIVGLESGILPYEPPRKDPADTAEERRLFYVALTRARRQLFLTRSLTRTLYGRKAKPGPSPFLDEIQARLKAADKLPDRPLKPKVVQLGLFD